MLLLLVFLIQPFIFEHDFAMANFEINQDDDTLTLNIKIDKENLENILHKKEGESIVLTIENEFVQKYVDEHFHLIVDDQKIYFNLKKIANNDYFYHLTFTSQNKAKQVIRHIQLKNTCLIDEVDKHSNIVNFQINGKYRSFKLDKARTRIEVKY